MYNVVFFLLVVPFVMSIEHRQRTVVPMQSLVLSSDLSHFLFQYAVPWNNSPEIDAVVSADVSIYRL